MRIKVDLDTTPEELRRFLGLPDVQPLQEEVMGRVRERLLAGLESHDPASLFRSFMQPGGPGFENLQQAFWDAVAGQQGAGTGGRSGGGGKGGAGR